MTTGPTDVKVTTAAGGPDGMPLALRLSEGLGPVPRWWTCKTHGPGTHSAWGCPECVREMRGEIERLRRVLANLRDACDSPAIVRAIAAEALAGPNVRVEAGPAAKCQARTVENSASPLCGPGILMLGLASNEGLA